MRRIDPGTFSFLQLGWWIWHAFAIAGLVILGSRLRPKY